MTVGELKKLLKGIPNDTDVLIEVGDGSLISLCHESEVATVCVAKNEEMTDAEFEEADESILEKEQVVILKHCRCAQPELGEINSQPELN